MNETKVAVVPARGGSTRLKNKNIMPLNGKPLIAHTIESVIRSSCFDKIYVASDGEDIIKVASTYDEVEVYRLDTKYTGDKNTVLQALMAMMSDIPKYDIFAYFLPTCPFRKAYNIREGMAMIDKCDSVVSVTHYASPIQLALMKEEDNRVVPIFNNLIEGKTNSKYIEKYYRPNGAFYMSHWDHLMLNNNFFVGDVRGYVMSKEKSHDIDDYFDFKMAELMIKEGIV